MTTPLFLAIVSIVASIFSVLAYVGSQLVASLAEQRALRHMCAVSLIIGSGCAIAIVLGIK